MALQTSQTEPPVSQVIPWSRGLWGRFLPDRRLGDFDDDAESNGDAGAERRHGGRTWVARER